jgi:hypothetical protein
MAAQFFRHAANMRGKFISVNSVFVCLAWFAVHRIRPPAELFFPFNPHLSCGHPLPLPRARNLAEKELFCGMFSRRRPHPSSLCFDAASRPTPG